MTLSNNASRLTFLILLVGVILRFYHFLRFDFINAPYRLGGLFLAFADQIAANQFRLPETIPFYSEGGIPFAYPPLGFYVEALLLRFFPESRFLIVNLLPPAVSSLALIAFFLLLRSWFGQSQAHIIAGTFAYALLPLAFANQIEAAGLAESFGSLSLVIFFYYVQRQRRKPDWKNAAWVGFALALSVLSSPGSALGAALLAALWGMEMVIKGRHRLYPAIGQVLLAAITGLLLSAPFWMTVMVRHGRGIFILPVLAQYEGSKQGNVAALFEQVFRFSITQDGAAFLWNALIFLGLLSLLLRGSLALPVSFFALFSIPRENTWLVALPAAMLATYGFAYVLAPLLRAAFQHPNRLKTVLGLLLCLFMSGWMVVQSFALSDALTSDNQWKINAEQVRQIEQARLLIPQDASVLVLGNDALLEWAPYLLQREVINTKFGLEWQPAKLEKVTRLNKQLNQANTWDEISLIVHEFSGQTEIYILSGDKKYLTSLSRASAIQIRLKSETPEIQLGILAGR